MRKQSVAVIVTLACVLATAAFGQMGSAESEGNTGSMAPQQMVTGKIASVDQKAWTITVDTTSAAGQTYSLDTNSQIVGPGNKKMELSALKNGDQVRLTLDPVDKSKVSKVEVTGTASAANSGDSY